MVEVVGPFGVAAPAAGAARAGHLRVVEAALGDDEGAVVARVDAVVELAEDVLRAHVEDGVDRVEPQPVDVEVADPALGALEDPFAHGVGVGVVEVDRLAPEDLVLLGEVGAEGLHRRDARGAQVVVDDVQDDAQTGGMGGVDEPLQPVRPAVAGLRGADVHAVVAPAVGAGELGDRHELDVGDAEGGEPGQVVDRRLERALLGERPDVQLVDHRVRQLRAAVPAAVGPRESSAGRRRATARAGPRAATGSRGRAAPGRRARRRSRRRRRPRRARCGCRGPRGAARGPRRARGRRRARGAGPRRGTRPSRRRLGPPPAHAPRGTRLRTSRLTLPRGRAGPTPASR